MNNTLMRDELSIEDVKHILSDDSIEVTADILSSLPDGLTDQMVITLLQRFVPTCTATAVII